jgi:S-adenosylmethionine hydrolase
VTRPIVFLTDYGLADEFVGVCHGVMARIAPGARVIDLAHHIHRQDVLHGAVTLARSVRYMPADAVYLAVVDPGVGSARRPVAIEASSGALLVGPDNGVLSMAWGSLGGAVRAVLVTSERVVLRPTSKTFHGRDVFAPAAAHLAAGLPLAELGPPLEPDALEVVELPAPMVTPGAVGTRVTAVDGFGNVQLNATPAELEAAGLSDRIVIGDRTVPRVSTFTDVPRGAPAVIVDSQGFLALVVNHGTAAGLFGLVPGATVKLLRAPLRA